MKDQSIFYTKYKINDKVIFQYNNKHLKGKIIDIWTYNPSVYGIQVKKLKYFIYEKDIITIDNLSSKN